MVGQLCRRPHDITVGCKAWLSTEHLRLPPSLMCKLAPKFIGPFVVLAMVTPVSFRLSLPVGWKIHDVFHVS